MTKRELLDEMSDVYGYIVGQQMDIEYNGVAYRCSGVSGWSDENNGLIKDEDIPDDLVDKAFNLHLDWWGMKYNEYLNEYIVGNR